MELPRHRIASIDWDYPDGASCIQLISNGKFFEARQCENTRDRVTELRPVNKAKDLTSDQTTYLSGVKAANCPIVQLRIGFRDPETGFQYFFLTNNFHPAAGIVVEIFKTCWQIELFFTWDKQNLKVKDVLGIFRKAVMTQIWIAIYHCCPINV